MNPGNIASRFNEEFQKELEAKDFPIDKLSCDWWAACIEALNFASLIGLGINPEDWKALIDAEEFRLKLTLYQFALLSNNLQARTPKDLHMSLSSYADLMAQADEYVKIWQELSNKLRDEVNERVITEQQMKNVAAGDKNGMKAVKAEA